jgi:hypothetical protein
LDDVNGSPHSVVDEGKVTLIPFDHVDNGDALEPACTPIRNANPEDLPTSPKTPSPARESEVVRQTHKPYPSSPLTDSRPFEAEAALFIQRAVEESGVSNDDLLLSPSNLGITKCDPAPSLSSSEPRTRSVPGCPSRTSKGAIVVAVVKKVGILLSSLLLFAGAISLFVITLVAMVVNVIAFALVVASLMVSCAIMIGPVIAAIVEGALMAMHHKPYEVGDRIVMSSTESIDERRDDKLETMSSTQCWVVESLNLLRTSLRNVKTCHVTTMSNSYLARRRIRNLTRSGQAQVNVQISLVSGSPTSKILVRLRCSWFVFVQLSSSVAAFDSLFRAIALPYSFHRH